MQDYLIVKGQIDPIENEVAPEIYKANEWQKLDRIVRATIRMHLELFRSWTEAARRKSFTKDSAEEAYVVQGSTD